MVPQSGGNHGGVGAPPDDVVTQLFNDRFFAADPGDYFRTKLQLLLVAAAKPSELRDLLEAGVEYAGISFRAAPDDDEVPDLGRFVTLEAQQMRHHAAESVVRAYLAFASGGSVPWLDLADRDSTFGQWVDETFRSPRPPEEIGRVGLGRTGPDSEMPAEVFEKAVEGWNAFLTFFARDFRDDAPMYNAIKHGLGAAPSNAVALFGSTTIGDGPSIEFPVAGKWVRNEREWSLVTRWVDMTESLAAIEVASMMLDSMWLVGRARYLRSPQSGRLFIPTTARPNDLRGERKAGGIRMSWNVLSETRLGG